MLEKSRLTPDEAAQMAWWSELPETERAHWLAAAGTAVVADAWVAWNAAAFDREPVAIDALVVLHTLGGAAARPSLVAELQRRHPRAIEQPLQAAIAAALDRFFMTTLGERLTSFPPGELASLTAWRSRKTTGFSTAETIQEHTQDVFDALVSLAHRLSTSPLEVRIGPPLNATLKLPIVRRFETDAVKLTVTLHFDDLAALLLGVERPSLEAIKAAAITHAELRKLMALARNDDSTP